MVTASETKWFRGQLHSHSYWSDGRGFPEQAIHAYKGRGYDFLCLSDHNRFADDPAVWREVTDEEGPWPPRISRAIFDAYIQDFGTGWVETRVDGSSTHVRLKTYAELKARFEEPGRFVLLPGVESTQVLNGIHLHLNYVNLPLLIPCIRGVDLVKNVTDLTTISALIALHAREVEAAASQVQQPYLLMLNHPFLFYCDILPQNLIDCPQVRFFEICNSCSAFPPTPAALSYTPEKFWDSVNAVRCANDQPLLYGIGSDDAHFYDPARIDSADGVGNAWIMVRATELTPRHLIDAMHRGDFYASSGVLLDEVTFSPASRVLRVAVKSEPGLHYRIHFITTKRGFDPTVTHVNSSSANHEPARTLPIYSDDIGRTVVTIEGAEGSYRMNADDLYVRARVESDRPAKIRGHFHPSIQVAWTQPYTGVSGRSAQGLT